MAELDAVDGTKSLKSLAFSPHHGQGILHWLSKFFFCLPPTFNVISSNDDSIQPSGREGG
eukprot:c31705_g1_i1 orf=18-197(-)